eukprot:13369821-Heterocapsa_arctica.AAC.1
MCIRDRTSEHPAHKPPGPSRAPGSSRILRAHLSMPQSGNPKAKSRPGVLHHLGRPVQEQSPRDKRTDRAPEPPQQALELSSGEAREAGFDRRCQDGTLRLRTFPAEKEHRWRSNEVKIGDQVVSLWDPELQCWRSPDSMPNQAMLVLLHGTSA